MGKLDTHAHTGINPSDPTPAEIRELCRRIRQSWSADEHRQRTVGLTNRLWSRLADVPTGWTPPEYSEADLPLDPTWLT